MIRGMLGLCLTLLASGACSPAVGLSEAEDRADLRIMLRVDRSVVAPGDTVRFRAVAHNAGNRAIQVGTQCGPTMDVRILTPQAQPISVLQAMVGPNGAFTCELGPYHFAQPRDSLTEHLAWRAPSERGSYMAVAGARAGSGLQDLSATVRITVQ